MANKMISEEELRDEFLSALIRSEEPMHSPAGFTDEVMNRIGRLPSFTTVKPYRPPVWLKWGIPGIIVASYIVYSLLSPEKKSIPSDAGSAFSGKFFDGITSWFSGIKIDIQFPNLDIPQTVIWIVAGGIVLTWSFILLARFLEKKYKSHQ